MSGKLLLKFDGWCLIRLPTDPDPPDEARGVSGYTFAFGDEPDLDAIVYLQLPSGFIPRSYGPHIGVYVREAVRLTGSDQQIIPALHGAALELLDKPQLLNRNWILTLPGEEPIVPFKLRISKDDFVIYRTAPIDPENPHLSIWELDEEKIKAYGARGLEFEPDTIGRATGIWDSLQVVKERHECLSLELARLEKEDGHPAKIAILKGRLHQLEIGLKNPRDRRVLARYFVERFGFPMLGKAEIHDDQLTILGTPLDVLQPWRINFWIGAWDPDIMCAFMQGSLEIPFIN